MTVFSKLIKKSSNQLMAGISRPLVGSSSNKTSGSPNKLCANNTFTFDYFLTLTFAYHVNLG